MVRKERSEYKVGVLVGTILTGASSLALMGFLGALGGAYYFDQQKLIREQEEKISELEKILEEKNCPPPGIKLPWLIPFTEEYQQTQPYRLK